MDKVKLGSQTAKNGFKNEAFVVAIFNNWQNEILAQKWLKAMGYDLESIEEVKAEKIKGSFKADVQVVILVQIKLQKLQNVQNIQVKLVSTIKVLIKLIKDGLNLIMNCGIFLMIFMKFCSILLAKKNLK